MVLTIDLERNGVPFAQTQSVTDLGGDCDLTFARDLRLLDDHDLHLKSRASVLPTFEMTGRKVLSRPFQILLRLQEPQLVAQAVPSKAGLLEFLLGFTERDL